MDRMAVDDRDVGGLSMGKFDGQAETKGGSERQEFLLADFVEESRSISDDHGLLETGYQTTLPNPRRPVNSGLITSQSE